MFDVVTHGHVRLPASIVEYAETIKLQNYKTNSVKAFQRDFHKPEGLDEVLTQVSKLVFRPKETLEPVFFSAAMGAKPHTDDLPKDYLDVTFVLPLILPEIATLSANVTTVRLNEGLLVSFNHTQLHSMQVSDFSGCTILMIAVKQ
jgi:hypothetical protein